jgi:predicted metallopeptidase
MIKYYPASDIEEKAKEIADKLGMKHDFSRVAFVRSKGSQSRYTLARCHALPRIMQAALNVKAHYVIEVISEHFDKMDEAQKTKTIIHELMHIPKAFGGGFKHHNVVNKKSVEKLYNEFIKY